MTSDDSVPPRRLDGLRLMFARRRPLACQEMVELVTAYLDDTLAPVQRVRFEKHLRQCDGCATYLAQLRVTVAMLGTITDEHLDPVFRDRLMLAFSDTSGSW